jgi:type I restriction enzyme S subunit
MGFACMLPDGINVSLTQRLMLLRPWREVIEPKLLLHFLNSSLFRRQVDEHCRGLTTPHIRVQDAPKFLLPLPPLAHQEVIVRGLDALQSQLEELKCLQAETAAELDALLPAILDRAFKGEL